MKKVLIANRAEIAVRVIRACHDLGLETVAVYSEADRESLHVLYATEAVCIGPSPASLSYLKIPHLLTACEITGADSIHPGYGFLSENAKFASLCKSCDVKFIGPSHEAILALGDKANGKDIAKKVKCPIIPGSEGVIKDLEDGLGIAAKIGYPVLIKATAGGGGKGIRVCTSHEEFIKFFHQARIEALNAFGNDGLYVEKMIVNPRHVEVQVVGDEHGNYVHLGERDCTIQRRRQKLIEECPSPVLSSGMRKKMGEAAVRILKAAQYASLATVEFLLDAEGNFYFMEVNTRVQVEHTITEELTGIDLVKLQLEIAMGKKLPFKQDDIEFRGHVMQFRINAENPHQGFMPSPGLIEYFVPAMGPHVRIDTASYAGYKIPPHYDSMIAKLIVRGTNRSEVIARAKRALREFQVGPIFTTIPFHQYMLDEPLFVSGKGYNINHIDEMMKHGCQFKQ